MSYKNFCCDNVTIYRILTKPGGLTYKDICIMVGCSKTKAYNIINSINKKIASTPNSKIPIPGRVSRQAFCEYMNWDFREIESFALNEIAVINHNK